MFCVKCGSPLSDDASFCGNCGAPVGGDVAAQGSAVDGPPTGQPVAPAQPAAPQPPERKGLSRGALIGIIAGAVAVAVAAIVVAAVMLGQPAEQRDGTGDAPATGDRQATPVDISISQIDNSAFPKMSLYIHLADQSGAELADAAADQFSVVEVGSDGVEHQATIDELLPLQAGDSMSINLVLDQSGSMDSSGKMGNAKTAAHAFIDEITGGGANFAEITSFDDYVYNVQPFTDDAVLLDSAVDSLRPDGETALYDALYWALQRTNMKSGSRVVIAFTDGAENASRYSLSDVEELSRLTGIPVYLVGIGDSIETQDLSALAAACNGRYYDASTDDLAQALQDIYASIYADQRSLYRLTYTSSFDEQTDAFRTVKVVSADGSPYSGSAESSYMPIDNVSSYDNIGNLNEYVLPDSDSRYYSKSELEQLSLWELYLARNEIFARHGRGFKNQDLVDYFSTRHWYVERYSPEEFDAMPTPLNDYEQKNTQAMLEIEQARNSPYLKTAK